MYCHVRQLCSQLRFLQAEVALEAPFKRVQGSRITSRTQLKNYYSARAVERERGNAEAFQLPSLSIEGLCASFPEFSRKMDLMFGDISKYSQIWLRRKNNVFKTLKSGLNLSYSKLSALIQSRKDRPKFFGLPTYPPIPSLPRPFSNEEL